jgi:sugar phosphate isomerase/epimerase
MRIGLSSYLFRWAIGTPVFRPARPMSPMDLVNRTAELGCDLVQIADHPMLEGYTERDLRVLKNVAEESSVELEVGTSGATEVRLRRFLDIACQLDARIVRIVLDGPDAHPSVEEAGALLKKIAPSYGDAGVTLAIENHFLIPSQDLAGLIEFVDHPAVGVCLDTANSVACQEWPLDTVRILAPYAVNVHMKDYVIGPHPEGVGVVLSGAPLGEGRQDIGGVVEAINSTGKEMNYILEQWFPRQADEPATLNMEMEWTRRNILAARRILQERS